MAHSLVFIVWKGKNEAKRRVKKRIMAVTPEWRDESLNAAAAHHAHRRDSTVGTATSRARTLETQKSSRYNKHCGASMIVRGMHVIVDFFIQCFEGWV